MFLYSLAYYKNFFAFLFFRESITGIVSALLQCKWIMNSAKNRCAFVRAEYVQLLILLSQWTNSCRLSESDSKEQQTVDNVTVDGSVQVVSATAEHSNSSKLQCLGEVVNHEMTLLLESESDVRIYHFASIIIHCSSLLLVTILLNLLC